MLTEESEFYVVLTKPKRPSYGQPTATLFKRKPTGLSENQVAVHLKLTVPTAAFGPKSIPSLHGKVDEKSLLRGKSDVTSSELEILDAG